MTTPFKERLKGSLLLLTGLALGASAAFFYKENHPKRPGAVLEQVKQHFAQQGPIDGSWIHYEPIEYTHFPSEPLVYIGGITRVEDGYVVQYQFACDIYSGEIIDLFEI